MTPRDLPEPLRASCALQRLLLRGRLVVCCGAGGAGKTTASAALALRAARTGRRTLVLSIDPACQLADTLGVDALSASPAPVNAHGGRGALWAMTLDPASAFDALVKRDSPSARDADRVLNDRLYRLLRDASGGLHDYATVAALCHLHDRSDFDLIVVDTPPAQAHLELLSAPERLTRFTDQRMMRWLAQAGASQRRGVSRWFNPAAMLSGLLGRLLGPDFARELGAFLDATAPLNAPLRDQARRLDAILRCDTTGFVVVSDANPSRVASAVALHQQLQRSGCAATAHIVNRVVGAPKTHNPEPDAVRLSALRDALGPDASPEHAQRVARHLRAWREAWTERAQRDQHTIHQLASRLGERAVRLLPQLEDDVRSIAQLDRLCDLLFNAPHSSASLAAARVA